MKLRKLHAGHIEVAVARLLNYRENIIVPNVSWGLGLRHECDLLALDKKDRFTEVEIKVTPGDLKADFKKGHGHESEFISRLVYAMPMPMVEKYGTLVPQHCGIIGVRVISYRGVFKPRAEWVKMIRHNNCKPGDKVIRNFMRLGCMRIWSMKEHNNKTITEWKE